VTSELVVFGAGALAGAFAVWFFNWAVNKRAQYIYDAKRGLKGREVRASNEEELFEAIGHFVMLTKSGKPAMEALKETGAAYPKVSARLFMKLAKGELPKGLEGFMGNDAQ